MQCWETIAAESLVPRQPVGDVAKLVLTLSQAESVTLLQFSTNPQNLCPFLGSSFFFFFP